MLQKLKQALQKNKAQNDMLLEDVIRLRNMHTPQECIPTLKTILWPAMHDVRGKAMVASTLINLYP